MAGHPGAPLEEARGYENGQPPLEQRFRAVGSVTAKPNSDLTDTKNSNSGGGFDFSGSDQNHHDIVCVLDDAMKEFEPTVPLTWFSSKDKDTMPEGLYSPAIESSRKKRTQVMSYLLHPALEPESTKANV